jgi:hypothetical protein
MAAKGKAGGGKSVPKAIASARKGGHPGFAALVKAGVPAGAMAKASRNASPAAKAKNPNLKKVKMPKKGK